ncbi:MAG: Bax inhibitor-1 family protein, partial [Prevotella sp.]|nr:Bax inhibitor-1 family protein [Prevotella sp.]
MDYKELDFRGFSAEQQLTMSEAFPVLMRKVYVWMTLALVITGFTAYGVANSPGVLQAIYSNSIVFWGLIIAEFALVIGVSSAINRLSLTTATLMFILYSVINGA